MIVRTVKQKIKKYEIIKLLELRMRHLLRRYQEKELGFLSFVVDPEMTAIDVGAADGVYTDLLMRLGAQVVAIEANPLLASRLTRLYGHGARVVCAAASSSPGPVTLRIPKTLPTASHGIATIEEQNALGGIEVDKIDVEKLTLDSLALGPVSFIKIDVEGHEYDVLRGSENIIERYRPAILVEAEDRHRPGAVTSIKEFLESFGYEGFMLDAGRLKSIKNFKAEKDQKITPDQLDQLNSGQFKGRYINNFLFIA